MARRQNWRKNFRITSYIYYACIIINYVCALLFLKTIGTPEGIEYIHWLLTVWIKEDFITCFCALSFRWFSSSPSSIVLSFSSPYYPGSLRIFFPFSPFFPLYPCRSRTTYLSHTSRLPVSLPHHYTTRFSWELALEISFLFYFTRSHSQKFTSQLNYSSV